MKFYNMKKVLITGGTRGIGKALVKAFASAGYQTAFCYHKSREKAEGLAAECGAKAFCFDLSDCNRISEFADSVRTEFGEIDILINNAGVSHYGLFQDTALSDYEKVFSINFQSVYFLTKEFVPAMIARKEGVVLNVSSIWGLCGASCEVLYSSAKAAMIGFTKALAKELGPSGVRVNCIAPGVVDTDMLDRFSPEEKEAMKDEIPMEEFTKPEEIANMALFLAGDQCKTITGQILSINGGMYT